VSYYIDTTTTTGIGNWGQYDYRKTYWTSTGTRGIQPHEINREPSTGGEIDITIPTKPTKERFTFKKGISKK